MEEFGEFEVVSPCWDRARLDVGSGGCCWAWGRPRLGRLLANPTQCPLEPESDGIAVRQRNDAMCKLRHEKGPPTEAALSPYVGGASTSLRRRIAIAATAAARQKLARRN
jgi:hypothetical protein